MSEHDPSPDLSQPDADADAGRTLGAFDATCVVIGAIIGVGIFFSPSRVAALAPEPWVVLAVWGLAGVLALAGALAFAELGRRRSGHGAQYQVLRDAFGPSAGFVFVFCNATAVQAGAIGIIAMICADNLAAAVSPSAGGGLSPGASLALTLSLIAAVTVANLAGVRWGSTVQNVTVVAKVAALLTIVGLAALAPRVVPTNDTAPTGALPAGQALLAGLVAAFFAYGGWQHALWVSGEVRRPRRNVPLSILAGTGVVVVVYVSVNAAYLALLGHGGVASSRTLAADAVAAVWPETGRRMVAASVAVSAFGVLNAQFLSGPRLIAGMAASHRGLIALARRSRAGAPVAAILLLTLAATGLTLAAGRGGIDRLLTGVVVVDGVFFALTAAAVFVLAPVSRPLPLARSAACLFIVGELGLLTGAMLDPATLSASLIGLGWIAGGLVLYGAMRAAARGG